MELLKLSKFKLQLQSMIGEVRDLRVRRKRFIYIYLWIVCSFSLQFDFYLRRFCRKGSDQSRITLISSIRFFSQCYYTWILCLLRFGVREFVIMALGASVQKQKQTEEEYSRKVHELQAELASSRETQEALERKVTYLQNDYSLLENKQNELKNTIQNLLQSRESFLNAYQESFCEMKCSVEARDRKIAILHRNITSHLSLFDSIEKEASAIKNVIHEVQGLVDQKEDVVAGLREKMDHVSTYEKVFIERISTLEEKIGYQETELQSKENRISELSAQLETAKIKNEYQLQIEEFQKTLKVKDLVVENLVSEKEALHSEVRSLEMILLRIQESVTLMTEEDRRVFTSILTFEQGADERKKHSRYNDTVDKMEELACEAPTMGSQENSVNVISSASPRCHHQNTDRSLIQDADHQLDSVQYLQHNTVSGHWQSINNNDHFATKDKCKELMNQPDSECSTNRG